MTPENVIEQNVKSASNKRRFTNGDKDEAVVFTIQQQGDNPVLTMYCHFRNDFTYSMHLRFRSGLEIVSFLSCLEGCNAVTLKPFKDDSVARWLEKDNADISTVEAGKDIPFYTFIRSLPINFLLEKIAVWINLLPAFTPTKTYSKLQEGLYFIPSLGKTVAISLTEGEGGTADYYRPALRLFFSDIGAELIFTTTADIALFIKRNVDDGNQPEKCVLPIKMFNPPPTDKEMQWKDLMTQIDYATIWHIIQDSGYHTLLGEPIAISPLYQGLFFIRFWRVVHVT